MKNISMIVLSNRFENKIDEEEYEVIFANGDNLLSILKNINSKYVVFSKEGDNIDVNYLKAVITKTKEFFDYCFINYVTDYKFTNEYKVNVNSNELKTIKPYYGEYIWSFIFDREKLLDVIEIKDEEDFNKRVDELFVVGTSIGKVFYKHTTNDNRILDNFAYVDEKKTEHHTNVFYMGGGCNGIFNGYISWLRNIGKCFKDKFNMTIIYDNMPPATLNDFNKYFTCIKYDRKVNYTCDRLFVTYTTYYYPKNIFYLDESYLFIHGNMSDYPNSRRFYDDIYTKYIGVSKTSAEKAVGYFPTDKFEYVVNPFILDKELVKPHLKLVSAQRHTPIKRPERIEYVADILRELDIPFTWNVFTDVGENTNNGGVVYRRRVVNPLPYFADSDYFVLLSDSEALSYAVVEALSVNTKVLVTPQDAYAEFGLKDGENAVIVPYDYFEEENKEKLVDLIKKI